MNLYQKIGFAFSSFILSVMSVQADVPACARSLCSAHRAELNDYCIPNHSRSVVVQSNGVVCSCACPDLRNAEPEEEMPGC